MDNDNNLPGVDFNEITGLRRVTENAGTDEMPTVEELRRSYDFVCTANEWRRHPVLDARPNFGVDIGDSTYTFCHIWNSSDAHFKTCITPADGDVEFVVALECLGEESQRQLAPYCQCGLEAINRVRPAMDLTWFDKLKNRLQSLWVGFSLFLDEERNTCLHQRGCIMSANKSNISHKLIRRARIASLGGPFHLQ